VVATDLSAITAAREPLPVVLAAGEAASGLADMLQQFIEQTIADSPRKSQQARRLHGRALFRSVEDDAVCVCIHFAGNRIELRDGAEAPVTSPSITADFLTIAHLTSGQENPFRLLAQGKLNARFSVLQVPFLLRMLRFMRIESASRRATRKRWALATGAAAAAAAAAYWYVTVGR
jgi:hypothetical protein